MTNATHIIADTTKGSRQRVFIEDEISYELNRELEAAALAYKWTMGGANETKRAYDRYVKAIRNAEAFSDIRNANA